MKTTGTSLLSNPGPSATPFPCLKRSRLQTYYSYYREQVHFCYDIPLYCLRLQTRHCAIILDIYFPRVLLSPSH